MIRLLSLALAVLLAAAAPSWAQCDEARRLRRRRATSPRPDMPLPSRRLLLAAFPLACVGACAPPTSYSAMVAGVPPGLGRRRSIAMPSPSDRSRWAVTWARRWTLRGRSRSGAAGAGADAGRRRTGQPANGRFRLDGQLLTLSRPYAGFAMTVTAAIAWRLTDITNGAVVYDRTLQGLGTATLDDAVDNNNRCASPISARSAPTCSSSCRTSTRCHCVERGPGRRSSLIECPGDGRVAVACRLRQPARLSLDRSKREGYRHIARSGFGLSRCHHGCSRQWRQRRLDPLDSDISNADFQESLVRTLANAKLASASNGRFRLDATLQLDQPFIAVNTTVTAKIAYRLTEVATGSVVYERLPGDGGHRDILRSAVGARTYAICQLAGRACQPPAARRGPLRSAGAGYFFSSNLSAAPFMQ